MSRKILLVEDEHSIAESIIYNLKAEGFSVVHVDEGPIALEIFNEEKFDLIISLLSLDYHYDFNLYIDYLKKVSTDKTKIIFDTIRAEYFKNIFNYVEIIRTDHNTVHKSKRIICSDFKN